MKKTILLILIFVPLILLTACGNSSEVADLQSRLEILEQENEELKNQSQIESSNSSSKKEDEYIDFIISWSMKFDSCFKKLNELIQNMNSDTSLLTDKVWIASLTLICMDISSICDDVIDYDINLVPEKHAEGHDILVNCATGFKEGMESIIKGIREDDVVSGLANSTKYIESASEYLSQATEIFSELL